MIPALLAPSDLFGTGNFGGLGPSFGVLLPMLFLVHSMKKFSDPGNSKRCALAEALVTGGWGLFSVGLAIKAMAPDYGWILARSVVPAGLLLLGGVGMGVAGLREVARTTPPLKGREQAILAMLMGGLALVAGGFGAFSGDRDRNRNSLPEEWRMSQQTPGTKLTFAEKGFRFTVPTSDWIRVNPNRLNPHAELAYFHVRKRISIMVIAINFPPGTSISQEKLAEVSRTEPKLTDPAAIVGESQPETLGALRGTAFTADFLVDKLPCRQWCWVYAAPQRMYNLVIAGPPVDFQDTVQDAARTLRGFELIEP